MTTATPKAKKRETVASLWHAIRKRHVFLVVAVLAGAICGLIALVAFDVIGSSKNVPQRHAFIQVAGLTVQRTRKLPARELMSGQLLEGKKGILVSLTVVNETDTPQPFIPVHQMILRDDLGNSYSLTPLGEVQKPIQAGTLKPGEKRSGELSFMVDDTPQPLHLIFDSEWSGGPPVSVPL